MLTFNGFLRLAEQGKTSDLCLLSLSNIFFMSPIWASSCFQQCPETYHTAVKAQSNPKTGRHLLPLQARRWCGELDAFMSLEDDLPLARMREMCHAFSSAVRGVAKTDGLCVMSTLLTRIIETFDNWTAETLLDESCFIDQHLTPIIKTVFSRHFNLNSRHGQTRIAGSNLPLKADFAVYYPAPDDDIYDLVPFEIKSPNNLSDAEAESDLVKLGKEMKAALDRLVDLGLTNPVVGGVLVNGYAVSIFTMQLAAEGVYLMSTLVDFHLLRRPTDIMLLPRIVESVQLLRLCIHPTQLAIDKAIIEGRTPDSDAPKKAWKRHSSAAPILIGRLQ
ncbi:hypothetical protein BCR43DRAFT_457584 [Syncephalastrum racemosum]|uniref:Uncharacterized protein n=1 Tax=Syncephalastrum racemosum TaxID=13706 RepID=A0A1X2HGZ6_SYNRA|nr:hypothetical protein BCR43DRAFT_457584 [Syncephalastrum racemosum]